MDFLSMGVEVWGKNNTVVGLSVAMPTVLCELLHCSVAGCFIQYWLAKQITTTTYVFLLWLFCMIQWVGGGYSWARVDVSFKEVSLFHL